MTDQNNSTNDVDDIDVTDASDVAGVAEVDATGETANVTKQDVPYRSGFVAVVGRPNVGKSTLINALIGKQIAIASSRPETTRKAIRGILTADHAQLVLVDTPGIHRPRTLLGQRLNDVVDESLADVDVVAFLLPADQEIGPGDKRILSRLRTDFATKREDGTFKWRIPLIAIVTKIDELGRQQLINKLIEINDFADFSDIVPVSALKHDNLAEVKNVLIEHTPEGPQMYPDDQISEERPEDTIAELVRGAFLETLDDELPHSLAVVLIPSTIRKTTRPVRAMTARRRSTCPFTWSVTPRSRSSSARAPRTSPTSRRSCAPRSTASSAKKPSSTSTSR